MSVPGPKKTARAAAGISAGIDMALHIVGHLTTPERARQVRDGIEYHPELTR